MARKTFTIDGEIAAKALASHLMFLGHTITVEPIGGPQAMTAAWFTVEETALPHCPIGIEPTDATDETPEGMPPFTHEERNTVLAALRVFQRCRAAGEIPEADPERFTQELVVEDLEHFEDCEPLTDSEIDALCERL